MDIKSNKGMGMLEIIVVLGLIALITPLVSMIFISSVKTSDSYSRFINQYDRVNEVVLRIRKDIEEAVSYDVAYALDEEWSSLKISFIPDEDSEPEVKIWRFQNGNLYIKTGGSEDYVIMLKGLETANKDGHLPSAFQKIDDRIILSVKPKADNTNIHKNRNIEKPVITEFSIKYKGQIE